MIRFEEMKLDENSPIYMQIIDFIRGGLAAGTRWFMGMNFRHTARAFGEFGHQSQYSAEGVYAMLEAGELDPFRHTGAKSCVQCLTAKVAEESRTRCAEREGGELGAVQTLKAAGYSKAEAIADDRAILGCRGQEGDRRNENEQGKKKTKEKESRSRRKADYLSVYDLFLRSGGCKVGIVIALTLLAEAIALVRTDARRDDVL